MVSALSCQSAGEAMGGQYIRPRWEESNRCARAGWWQTSQTHSGRGGAGGAWAGPTWAPPTTVQKLFEAPEEPAPRGPGLSLPDGPVASSQHLLLISSTSARSALTVSVPTVGTLRIVMETTPDVPLLEDPLALEQQVCFALAVASRNVIAVYRPLLEPLGLTHPQYLVMLALWQHQPLSVRASATCSSSSPATLSPLLKRLEAAGLLRRERESGNERALALTLTPEGLAAPRGGAEDPAGGGQPAGHEHRGADGPSPGPHPGDRSHPARRQLRDRAGGVCRDCAKTPPRRPTDPRGRANAGRPHDSSRRPQIGARSREFNRRGHEADRDSTTTAATALAADRRPSHQPRRPQRPGSLTG